MKRFCCKTHNTGRLVLLVVVRSSIAVLVFCTGTCFPSTVVVAVVVG